MPRNLKLTEKSISDEAYEEVGEEIIEDAFEGISKSLKAGRWIEGGHQRDRLIQKMLKYANEFGMHYTSANEETIENSFVRGHQCMSFLKKYTEYVNIKITGYFTDWFLIDYCLTTTIASLVNY